MKNIALILGVVVAATAVMSSDADAQLRRKRANPYGVIYTGQAADGMTHANDIGRLSQIQSAKLAKQNPFSPRPNYTYSNRGIESQLIHQWNQQEAQSHPWHTGYSHWRYDEPTALVVPPTAAYHTSYAWGVGQVRSTPIHHQFGRGGAGMIGGGEGMFSRTPYWPSSTDQFGVSPVRAPW